MNRLIALFVLELPLIAVAASSNEATARGAVNEPLRSVDVCIYGATPAGVVAAIAAKQEGMTVLLVEPSRWIGGILGAGLKPNQDAPEPRAVGGLTKSRVFALGDSPPVIRENFVRWLKEIGRAHV